MRVSVIIPCHNAAEYICEALDSAAEQSYAPHEIIVVDDGSKDDSVSRVLASSIPVKLLRVDFGNAASARNVGIEAASGEWLAFLDADNRWYPHHLQQALELLTGTTDVACMASPGESPVWLGEQVERARLAPVQRPTSALDHEAFIRFRLERAYGFPVTGQLLRTDVVRHVGAFDVTQVRRHDFELLMRVIHGRTWSFHPRPSWWIRPPRAGDISADDVKCRYYALRAMKLNQSRYAGRMMTEVLRRNARAAMLSALIGGTRVDIQRAWALARSHLTVGDRCVFAWARRAPGLFKVLYARRSTRMSGVASTRM